MIIFLFALGLVLLVAGNFAIRKKKTITKLIVVPTSLHLSIKKSKNKVLIYWQEDGKGALGFGEFDLEIVAVHQTENVDGKAIIQIQKNGFHEVSFVNIYTPKEVMIEYC
jgi:hypothetical protein